MGVKETPKFIGKSPSGEANRLLCIIIRKGSCQKGNSRNYLRVPVCEISSLQRNAGSETSVHTSHAKRYMQLQRVQADKTKFRVRLLFRGQVCSEQEKVGLTLGSSRQNPKICEIQTLQHPRNDPSNGPERNGKDSNLDFAQERVHISRFII